MQKHYAFIRTITCALIYIFPCLSHAQNQYNQLVPIRENGLWGFIDTAGRVVIAPKFLSAGDFSEELAPVRIAGSYGYVNEKGKSRHSLITLNLLSMDWERSGQTQNLFLWIKWGV